MTINRYTINVTLSTNVTIEAESEAEALANVRHAIRQSDDLADGAEIVSAGIDPAETIIDGPAKYEAWIKAVEEYHRVVDACGRNSPEAKAAYAISDAMDSGV